MREVPFDREAVRAALTSATREAWDRVSSLEPPERVYGLVLYEGAEYGYVCVTPFTEEGLDRVTDEYREGRWSEEYQGTDGRESLRWSTCDSPHHYLGDVSSPPLVSGATQRDLWQEWEQDEEPFRAHRQEIRGLCMETLQMLDREGLFDASRSDLTLMIENRDGMETADERRAIVAALNPPAVVARYEAWAARSGATGT